MENITEDLQDGEYRDNGNGTITRGLGGFQFTMCDTDPYTGKKYPLPDNSDKRTFMEKILAGDEPGIKIIDGLTIPCGEITRDDFVRISEGAEILSKIPKKE